MIFIYYLELACHDEQNLFNELRSLSYGYLKLAKWKMIKKTVFHSSSLVYGERVFLAATKKVRFAAGTNGE